MKAIWKVFLAETSRQTLALPQGSELLTVDNQHGCICLWFIVPNAENPVRVQRNFAIYGTGQMCPDIEGEYVGTVLLGSFVWHVFDLGEVEGTEQ